MASSNVPAEDIAELSGCLPLTEAGSKELARRIKTGEHKMLTDQLPELGSDEGFCDYIDILPLYNDLKIIETCNAMKGKWIYVLSDYTNPNARKDEKIANRSIERYKVGKTTTDPTSRCKELRTGNVDLTVHLAWKVTTNDPAKLTEIETKCHQALKAYKIIGIAFNEWFYCGINTVIQTAESVLNSTGLPWTKYNNFTQYKNTYP